MSPMSLQHSKSSMGRPEVVALVETFDLVLNWYQSPLSGICYVVHVMDTRMHVGYLLPTAAECPMPCLPLTGSACDHT